jgi:hypothetical protein
MKKNQNKTNFNIFNNSFRVIRRFVRVAKFYGYEISISNRSDSGSCYVDFCKNKQINFKFRFSSHFLSTRNQIPAGVINDYTNLKYCIRDIQHYDKVFKKMTKNEIDELWINR